MGATAAVGVAGAAHAAEASAIRLANDAWSIEIDPRTLAIAVTPAGGSPCIVSRGVAGHTHTGLAQRGQAASWTWDGRFTLACELIGTDLSLSVTASVAGDLMLLDQPPAAMGKGLMLPIAEGYYIARDDALWRSFLSGDDEGLDTNDSLSVPMWGMDHGGHTLHWLLANPFNNILRFAAEGEGLAMTLSHRFTTLAPGTPTTMLLHLGPGDLLAGSRRYRRYLIDSGGHTSLSGKIARTPSAAKLIGATHLYLWGNGLIAARDVRDWPGFVSRLKGGSGVATRIRGRLEPDVVALLDTAAKPLAYQQKALARGFNGALNDLAREAWQTDDASASGLVSAYAALREAVMAAFAPVLAPDHSTWGGGLSKASFSALEAAGLQRLWIGLGDGWEGGLWCPDAVRAAADAGYLIGPYDSYETAIPPGQRPDWATAQLGKAAYDHCGVMDEDGSLRLGFQRTGRYTNTRCVTPILKDRIPALAKAGGFNSWFLDVYATGMVFDDHRPGATMTMAENAAADIAACRFVSDELQLPTGSEGGNAVGAEGVLFAHGIETPLFGWGDPDLRKNPQSPFYFGNWYPPEEPGAFFKPVPLKQPYLSRYFDSRTRLPLYQGVFHGSVISTHQWGFDQLKLANAATDRALIQQLYNYPPLFHVSAATLGERLPAITRHDAFFRPMHARLAERTLEGFEWLSDDRLIQQTRFSDGTRLIANFSDAERSAGGVRMPAKSVTAIGGDGPNLVFEA